MWTCPALHSQCRPMRLLTHLVNIAQNSTAKGIFLPGSPWLYLDKAQEHLLQHCNHCHWCPSMLWCWDRHLSSSDSSSFHQVWHRQEQPQQLHSAQHWDLLGNCPLYGVGHGKRIFYKYIHKYSFIDSLGHFHSWNTYIVIDIYLEFQCFGNSKIQVGLSWKYIYLQDWYWFLS